jgi:hypothetical protein
MRCTTAAHASWIRQLVATAGMLSLFFAATVANAAIVPVVNSSFESPTANPVTAFSPGVITGWVLSDPVNQGVFNPSLFPAAGITAPAPFQTAYLNSGNISQTLPTFFTSGTTYTLRVDVGDRADLPFPGYRVQLRAGATPGTSVLLAEEFSLVPTTGFLTSTVTFTTFAPVTPGTPLEIRLISNGSQVNFDDVRLDASPAVPVPASLAIWGIGAFAVGLVYRRRKAAR